LHYYCIFTTEPQLRAGIVATANHQNARLKQRDYTLLYDKIYKRELQFTCLNYAPWHRLFARAKAIHESACLLQGICRNLSLGS